ARRRREAARYRPGRAPRSSGHRVLSGQAVELTKEACVLLVDEDGDEWPLLDFGDAALLLLAPLGKASDGRLHRQADLSLGPFGGVVDGVPVCISEDQHVDVVGGAAGLAGVAGGPGTEEENRPGPVETGELASHDRRRTVGGEEELAESVEERMDGVGPDEAGRA